MQNQEDLDTQESSLSKRCSFWTDQATTQLGYSIDIFIGVGIVFLGFLLAQTNNGRLLSSNIVCIGYLVTVILAAISVALGLLAVLSRLTDIRLTRHILSVRKTKAGSALAQKPSNYSKKDFKLMKAIFPFYVNLIEDEDYGNPDVLNSKFEKILCQAKYCGKATWLLHQRQIESFVISIVFFLLTFCSWFFYIIFLGN